jgi:hypothetical protein
MAKRFGAYQKDVHMCKPGAKQALEDFMESCRNYVASVTDVRVSEVVFTRSNLFEARSGL